MGFYQLMMENFLDSVRKPSLITAQHFQAISSGRSLLLALNRIQKLLFWFVRATLAWQFSLAFLRSRCRFTCVGCEKPLNWVGRREGLAGVWVRGKMVCIETAPPDSRSKNKRVGRGSLIVQIRCCLKKWNGKHTGTSSAEY